MFYSHKSQKMINLAVVIIVIFLLPMMSVELIGGQ